MQNVRCTICGDSMKKEAKNTVRIERPNEVAHEIYFICPSCQKNQRKEIESLRRE